MDDWLSEHGIQTGALQGEGIAAIMGYGHYLGLEDWVWMLPGAFDGDFTMWSTNKTWDFQTPTAPKWNGAPLATGAAVADAISAATNTLATAIDAAQGSIATNAAAIGALDGRVGEVETQLEEYWCKWQSNMSNTNVNWIPTNWPARTVHCVIALTTAGATNIVAFPDWSPEEPHTLDLYLYKSASGAGILTTADGTAIASSTGTSGGYSRCTLSYAPNVGWLVVRHTINQPFFVVGSTMRYPIVSALPEDGTFAPVVEQPATLLSFSSSLSPRLAPAAFDSGDFPIDAFTDDPTALDDLAPEDFPEDLDDFADAPDDTPAAEE